MSLRITLSFSLHNLTPTNGRVAFAFLCLAFAAGVLVPSHGARAAFPTTGILDNFNRADENPLANGTWTCPSQTGAGGLSLTSNQANSTFGSADCYWSPSTFGPNSEAFVTITVPSGVCVALHLRLNNPNSSSLNGYWYEWCGVAGAGNDTFTIYRIDNGSFTSIAAGTQEVSSGDSIGAEAIGSSLKMYYKAAAGSWVQVVSVTDNTYSGSGRIGLHLEDTTERADDFGGGTVALGVQVSSRSDTLSDSRSSATSNHTVAFTVNNAIYGSSLSGSSTLKLTLPSGFTIPVGMDCGDVDAATSVQFSFNYPGCAATATAWGFSATGSSITLVPPSGTGVYVPTSTQVTIKIGSNATVGQQGSHWITNPSTGGVYTISVGGTFGGSGNMLVSINSGVSVQATVAESLSFTVSPSVTSIKWVQDNFTDTANNTGALASFSSNNAAGNLIVIALDWDNQAVNVLSVTDAKGNVYTAAAPPVNGAGNLSSWRDQMFYAKNIGAGANTVNVEFSGSVHSELYIHEYSGADTNSPLDVTTSSVGNSSTANSGSKTTNFPNELVFGYCQASTVNCNQGANFAARQTDNGNLSEDMIATSTGSYSASSNLGGSNDWVMSMATFKPGPQCVADDGATVNRVLTTATSVPFGIISPNTFYQGCQDLIVSTNAGNGYSVTVQESSAMRTADGRFFIPDTTCDGGTCSESAAAAWTNATKNGLGHTCFNELNHDCNAAYSSGTNFRQAANLAAGETAQSVMSSSTAATATGRVKYRLSTGLAQPAGTYTTIISYTIYATY
jgi:hypothetical protein